MYRLAVLPQNKACMHWTELHTHCHLNKDATNKYKRIRCLGDWKFYELKKKKRKENVVLSFDYLITFSMPSYKVRERI